jgi:hypothetical protein
MESTVLHLARRWPAAAGPGVVIRMRLLAAPRTGLALARRLERARTLRRR